MAEEKKYRIKVSGSLVDFAKIAFDTLIKLKISGSQPPCESG